MKRNLQGLIMVCLASGMVWMSSCSKDPERPLPETDSNFEVVTEVPEVFLPVKFENLSLNASSYVWDYGDGESDSGVVVSPTHFYDDDGNYTVKLRAYNEDGLFTESQKTVSVGRRYLTSAAIYNLNMKDTLGNPWDDGGYPDIFLLTGAITAQTLDDVLYDYYENVNNPDDENSQVPIGFVFSGDFELYDDTFFVEIDEVDSALVDGVMEPEFVPMAYVEFNPILGSIPDSPPVTISKFDDGTGIIQIPLVAIEEYQFLITFEVR